MNRRNALLALPTWVLGIATASRSAAQDAGPVDSVSERELTDRFEYLSQNGNSNCSRAFLESIATMSPEARLQGSCCGPMSEHRYREQIGGLAKYASITLIPPDPYDVQAGIAQQTMAWFAVELTVKEQVEYDYAMENSAEQGPCCCQCWRWPVYGGLAKYLIRQHDFTGEQIAEIWDLSDGCGGDDHVHS